MKIFTTLGLVDIEDLSVTDHVEFHDNARVTATEWRKDGEVVRRDVNVNILRGLDINSAQENVGG